MKGDNIILIFLTYTVFVEAANMTAETRLIQSLFINYDAEARPVTVASDQVNISLSMNMVKLLDIDTKSQHLSVSGWMKVEWKDHRLTWNAAEYPGVDYIVCQPNKLWMPSFVLSNSASGTIYNSDWYNLFKLRVYSDGSIKWTPGGKFKSDCQIDVTFFPFDEQICEFVFRNWVYTGEKVNMTYIADAEETFLKNYVIKNGEWNVLGIKIIRFDRYTETGTESWPEVHFGIKCKRKPLFYVTNIILLSLLLAVLVQLMFKLPAESGERISMGVTLLLSFSVFILMIDSSIPDTYTNVPVIVVYLIGFMTLTTLGICESVLMLYCHHHNGNYKAPKWVRFVVFNLMISSLCEHNRQKIASNDEKYKNDKSKEREDDKEHKDKDGVSLNLNSNIRLFSRSNTSIMHDTKTAFDDKDGLENTYNDKEAIIKEWQTMAVIIDKFMFWLFLVLFILLMLILLIIIPYSQPGKDINNTMQWAGF